MWLTLTLLTVLAAPVPDQDTLYYVDEGELVVAWDPNIDASWVGAPQAAKRLPSNLLSIPRDLHLDKLPPAMRGLVGSTLTLYAADGATCNAKVTSLRARCLAYDYGTTDDADVCIFPERAPADVCNGGTFIIGALKATSGRLCKGVLATTKPGTVQMYKPLPRDREKDSEVLKAFRATGWWKAAQSDYLGSYPDEPNLGSWDASGDAPTTIRRFDPPTADAPALAIAWRDLADEADGGAPTQRLAAVFIRAADGWKLHRAWAPGPKPQHFFLRGDAPEPLLNLHALSRGHDFAIPPVRTPDGNDYEELFDRAVMSTPDWRVSDISDPFCTPRHLRTPD